MLFLGNDVSLHQELIKNILGNKVTLGNISTTNPRPSELARVGLEKEPTVDIHSFTPNYIRLAEAETNWLASQKDKA